MGGWVGFLPTFILVWCFSPGSPESKPRLTPRKYYIVKQNTVAAKKKKRPGVTLFIAYIFA